MGGIVVKKADRGDLRDLMVLTCEFLEDIASQAGMDGFMPDKQKIGEKLPEFLDMPDYAVFMAKSPKGHLLGFCTVFSVAVQIREEPYAILDKLYVRPAYRRRQIGHRLVEETKRFVRSCKGKRLQATLPAFFVMEGALAFFRAERFYETGGRKHKIAI